MKLLRKKRKSSNSKTSNKEINPIQSTLQPEQTQVVSKPLDALIHDKEKMAKISHLVSPDSTYTKLKYKSEIYHLGDVCLIYSSNETLIGEITKILPVNGFKEYPTWPTVEVRWYYKKSDLNRKKNHLLDIKNFNSISEYELFPSKHKDIIFIETILCKCKVFTYEVYDNLKEHNELTYFTRANYDPVSQLLSPKFDEWVKGCVCKRPLNPDQFYIKCDLCGGWFHPECCGLDVQTIEENKEFFCPNCIKTREEPKPFIIKDINNELMNNNNNDNTNNNDNINNNNMNTIVNINNNNNINNNENKNNNSINNNNNINNNNINNNDKIQQ